MSNTAPFSLPLSIITRADIVRLAGEVEEIDNDMTTAKVHVAVGSRHYSQPVLSERLTDFLYLNRLNLNDDQQRRDLITHLHALKDQAPLVHMTFAAPADTESLKKLTEWLRANIHPQSLVSTGLQPSLVAGVYVRTPNHVHDFSLRAKLKGQRGAVAKELESLRGGRQDV